MDLDGLREGHPRRCARTGASSLAEGERGSTSRPNHQALIFVRETGLCPAQVVRYFAVASIRIEDIQSPPRHSRKAPPMARPFVVSVVRLSVGAGGRATPGSRLG